MVGFTENEHHTFEGKKMQINVRLNYTPIVRRILKIFQKIGRMSSGTCIECFITIVCL